MYICYSLKKSDEVTMDVFEPLTERLRNFGITLNYPENEELVNEDDYGNKEDFYIRQNVCVVILTDKILQDEMMMSELKMLKILYENEKVYVVTIGRHGILKKLPGELSWLSKTYVISVNDIGDIYKAANTVAWIHWRNKLYYYSFKNNPEIDNRDFVLAFRKLKNKFIDSMLLSYQLLDVHDLATRVGFMYSIYKYLRVEIFPGNKKDIFKIHEISIENVLSQIAGGRPTSLFHLLIVQYCLYDIVKKLA